MPHRAGGDATDDDDQHQDRRERRAARERDERLDGRAEGVADCRASRVRALRILRCRDEQVEFLLGLGRRIRTLWSAPRAVDHDRHDDDDEDGDGRKRHPAKGVDDRERALAEGDGDGSDATGPGDAAERVREQETPVRHGHGAREGAGEHAQESDEAPEEDGVGPPLLHEADGRVDAGDAEVLRVPLREVAQQAGTPTLADVVAERVADDGANGSGRGEQPRVDPGAPETQEYRRDEHALAGQGQAEALERDDPSNEEDDKNWGDSYQPVEHEFRLAVNGPRGAGMLPNRRRTRSERLPVTNPAHSELRSKT